MPKVAWLFTSTKVSQQFVLPKPCCWQKGSQRSQSATDSPLQTLPAISMAKQALKGTGSSSQKVEMVGRPVGVFWGDEEGSLEEGT
mmetsp:Transcript_10020/g.21651  ORF Transcript_10020/g.21651 Transcript_10020/m.21651 type:complete len:86 (-) Transcript_10020:35-292(-)